MQRGKLVIFEGGEGAGKTTLVDNLVKHYQDKEVSVLATREPGGTPFAEEVRSSLVKKREIMSDIPTSRAQITGFYAARFDHIEKVILPALESGELLLCDRFELSSFAYQVYSQSPELYRLFASLHSEVCGLLQGYELTYVVCDIDPKVGVARALKRAGSNHQFDEMNISFHNKVRAGMEEGEKIIDSCFTFHHIDAHQSPEEVMQSALEIIEQ